MARPPTEDQPILKYDTMVVSPRGISEVDNNKVVIFVPAAEIERITLRFGRSGHRPILTMVVGVVLAVIGLLGLIQFILAPAGFRYELGMVAFGLIGGSVILDTLKRRYFFEIHRKRDTSRVVLSKRAHKSGVQEFCTQVQSAYKYAITDAA